MGEIMKGIKILLFLLLSMAIISCSYINIPFVDKKEEYSDYSNSYDKNIKESKKEENSERNREYIDTLSLNLAESLKRLRISNKIEIRHKLKLISSGKEYIFNIYPNKQYKLNFDNKNNIYLEEVPVSNMRMGSGFVFFRITKNYNLELLANNRKYVVKKNVKYKLSISEHMNYSISTIIATYEGVRSNIYGKL